MRQESWKRGNRRLFLAFIMGAVFLCGGCGDKETELQEKEAAGDSVAAEETEANASLEEQSEQTEGQSGESSEREAETAAGTRAETGSIREQRIKNTDNETLLTTKTNTVWIMVPENQEAEDSINRFFADRHASWQDRVEIYRELAEEDFGAWCVMKSESTDRENGSQEDGHIVPETWNGYELDRIYRVMRADEEIISILEEEYVYGGGDRGNTVRVAYNFDARTGKRMSLEEVASDLDEIRQKSVEYLGAMLPESEIAEALNGDYVNHLEDILTDGTWYLDGNGLHIICNESVITPRSAGVLDFLLPYEKVDVVKERFQLAG